MSGLIQAGKKGDLKLVSWLKYVQYGAANQAEANPNDQ